MQTGECELGMSCDWATLAGQLQGALLRRKLETEQLLFDVGDPADSFFIVESGHLRGEVRRLQL